MVLEDFCESESTLYYSNNFHHYSVDTGALISIALCDLELSYVYVMVLCVTKYHEISDTVRKPHN